MLYIDNGIHLVLSGSLCSREKWSRQHILQQYQKIKGTPDDIKGYVACYNLSLTFIVLAILSISDRSSNISKKKLGATQNWNGLMHFCLYLIADSVGIDRGYAESIYDMRLNHQAQGHPVIQVLNKLPVSQTHCSDISIFLKSHYSV